MMGKDKTPELGDWLEIAFKKSDENFFRTHMIKPRYWDSPYTTTSEDNALIHGLKKLDDEEKRK
jgi:hypothetical protein